MYCVRKITDDLTWLGANDRRLALFESAYPIPEGISYNAYLLSDEKTVLLDTADKAVAPRFLENLAHALGGRPLDYLVVNHMALARLIDGVRKDLKNGVLAALQSVRPEDNRRTLADAVRPLELRDARVSVFCRGFLHKSSAFPC